MWKDELFSYSKGFSFPFPILKVEENSKRFFEEHFFLPTKEEFFSSQEKINHLPKWIIRL